MLMQYLKHIISVSEKKKLKKKEEMYDNMKI
jgi:hypothetical protein